MKYYTCDPSWPICLYDFTHRNLNPKFNTLRVARPLTDYIRDGYFSYSMLSRRGTMTSNKLDDLTTTTTNTSKRTGMMGTGRKASNEIVLEEDLVIQRSMHLCSLDPKYKFFQHNFKARYNAMDQKLFNNDKVKFDVDDELDAIEKARLFVSDVCLSLDNLPMNSGESHDPSNHSSQIFNIVSVEDVSNGNEDDMLAIVNEEEK